MEIINEKEGSFWCNRNVLKLGCGNGGTVLHIY